ncbi:hypothetical protein CPB86DRAFT_524480 [Serendipita vermifera]|nr:hypothetical protein CPB86DRAFT_524480 [Serendipita vermifera]
MPKAPQDVFIPSIYFSRKYKSTDINKWAHSHATLLSQTRPDVYPPPRPLQQARSQYLGRKR